jgi:serine/threonine protein kinase
MVDVDPPGYRRVRRLNRRRPGERQLSDLPLPGADQPSIGQPAVDQFDGDQIHLAVRLEDGAEVAVRVYAHPIRAERDLMRFEQEAVALKAVVGDSHVVGLDEIGVTPAGFAYLVMEYCVAGSVYDHLQEVGRYGPGEVRRIAAKLAGALGAAHRRDIVHRAVKPANILINRVGEPVLSDFRLVSLGTAGRDFMPPLRSVQPAFTAPEAYLPELMTPASDIYALGATMYAMLAGWPPRAHDPQAFAIDADTLADLPRVPWSVMELIRTAMAHDPADRFADAYEFRAALLDAEPD